MDDNLALDPLFSTERLHDRNDPSAPLIVVGLPRSGSSFLSHILSQIPDWYVFDDLYAHRKATELKVENPLSQRNIKDLMFFLGWQIRARHRFGLYAIPSVAESEVPAMDAALIEAFTKQSGSWAELQEEWMIRLARRSNCSHWGYKMPGAFRYIPDLLGHYPDALFMFIMRNPYKVLSSYKHMPATSQDGDPRRYHPIAYAFYWRMAVRCYLKYRDVLGARVTLVQFEDLVSEPQITAEKIAVFLMAEAPKEVHVPSKPNSSFGSSPNSQDLTGLEQWLLVKIAGKEIEALGYKPHYSSIVASDFVDFLAVSMRFTGYYLGRFAKKLKERVVRS